MAEERAALQIKYGVVMDTANDHKHCENMVVIWTSSEMVSLPMQYKAKGIQPYSSIKHDQHQKGTFNECIFHS